MKNLERKSPRQDNYTWKWIVVVVPKWCLYPVNSRLLKRKIDSFCYSINDFFSTVYFCSYKMSHKGKIESWPWKMSQNIFGLICIFQGSILIWICKSNQLLLKGFLPNLFLARKFKLFLVCKFSIEQNCWQHTKAFVKIFEVETWKGNCTHTLLEMVLYWHNWLIGS